MSAQSTKSSDRINYGERNREIVKMLEDGGKKVREVADKWGITTSRVVQIHKQFRLKNPRKVSVPKSEVAEKYKTTPEKLEITNDGDQPAQAKTAPAPASKPATPAPASSK